MIKKYKYHIAPWIVILIGWAILLFLVVDCKETGKPETKEQTVIKLQQHINKYFKETTDDTLVFYTQDTINSLIIPRKHIVLRSDSNQIISYYPTYKSIINLNSK
jgi:hypothetical protein